VRVPGVDRVEVFPEAPIALATLDAFAAQRGEWVFVDTDVRLQRDVRHVFEAPFDIAVADRAGTYIERDLQPGRTFMQAMPYNKGVVYSRSFEFWEEAAACCRTYDETKQAWMGDQKAMNQVIASGLFNVKVLPNTYNYPPKRQDEDVADKHALHYKGSRKAWMLERAV
jgi:hypothetical protein